jgi:glycosyltransferase involved in cell wall biosynthesis
VTLDIMMPFYGRVDHFMLAVQSVLEQNDPDWRLVIVDDVYPDTSAGEWAVALGDERITYIRNEANLRPSRNYRKCVGLMQADFAVIMGCDDVMLPDYVARARELTRQYPSVSVFQPGVEVIDSEGRVHHPLPDRVKRMYRPKGHGVRVLSGEALAVSLLRASWFYFPSLVWNVEHLRRHEFRTDLDVTQDIAMLLELIEDGGSIAIDDQVVFRYRRHGESVSAVTGVDGSKFAQERTVFAEAERGFHALGWKRAARAARFHLTSRLHSAAALPSAVRAGDVDGRRNILRHTFGGFDD